MRNARPAVDCQRELEKLRETWGQPAEHDVRRGETRLAAEVILVERAGGTVDPILHQRAITILTALATG